MLQGEARLLSAGSTLAAIDSLMGWHPDSAFALLQEFTVSPEADSLDGFDSHYCHPLVAELLYKNDCAYTNRTELLRAADYFDSIAFTQSESPSSSPPAPIT